MEVDSWNILKKFTREELIQMLPADVKFKTKPWTHQIASFLACVANDGFLSALDLGTGKTKVAIDSCEYLLGSNKYYKVLCIVLNSAVENWADEVIIHSHRLPVCLRGTADEKWGVIDTRANYYIINYEGLRTILTTSKTNRFGQKLKGIMIDQEAMGRIISKKWDAVIYDESHLLKNERSLNFKIAKQLCEATPLRYLLTGTPIGNDLLGIWGQYYMVDFGKTYTNNYITFRSAYFDQKPVYRRGNLIEYAAKYKVHDSGKKTITKKLYRKAIRYGEWEVDDLPPKVYRSILYKLTIEQHNAYENEIALIDEMPDESIVNLTMIFRQICSGFIKKDDKSFKKNPKLEALKDLLVDVVPYHKVVVFTEFKYSVAAITKMLKGIKVKHKVLDGTVKSSDKHKVYSMFEANDKYRVLVANIKSGGASINLVSATYCIFYENGYSVINRKQAEKRIHRGGQTKRCFFYDLCGRNTVEMYMRAQLKSGLNVFDAVVDGKRSKKSIKSRLRGGVK